MTASVRSATLPPVPPPRWILRERPDPEFILELSRELCLPPALCSVLAVRGVMGVDAARAFLRPRLQALPDPALLLDSERAVARLDVALEEGETILVHGDYDVDGVCATALLTLWLRRLGARVHSFIPHRVEDGYDLGEAGIRAAVQVGASLMVTCDTGVTAVEAVRRAREAGVEVIITDHHTPGPELPSAVAVVNPTRADCPHPEGLAGTGVAFQLARLLGRRRGVGEDELYPHLDLVALATVADLVPLTGANRILVRFGLRYLTHTSKVGLRALLRSSGALPERAGGSDSSPKEASDLDAGQVGFVVAPRINAAGRMGSAGDALRLLLTEDPDEAEELAQLLEERNRVRREEDRRTLEEALELLQGEYDPERDAGVVLAGEGWHPGVIGIVASRVVERIHRPVVLVAMGEDRGKGSARSIPGVHLHEALTECGEHLLRYGGHRQAAGLEVTRERLEAFRSAFSRAVRRQWEAGPPSPVLRADAEVSLGDADEELHRWLEYLGPFGMGNPRPVFLARGARVSAPPRVVGGRHLKLRLENGRGCLDAIGFGLAERIRPASVGERMDLAFQLRENSYRGRRSLQARLLDLRSPGEGAFSSDAVPGP